MSTQAPSTRSLSLQWKLVCRALVVLALIFSAIAWQQQQQLQLAQQQQLQRLHSHGQQLLQSLAQAHYQKTLRLAHSLAQELTPDLSRGDVNAAQTRLQAQHQQYNSKNRAGQSSWVLLSAVQPPFAVGDTDSRQVALEWLAEASATPPVTQLSTQILCRAQHCSQLMVLPLLQAAGFDSVSNSHQPEKMLGTLVINSDLNPVRQQLQQLSELPSYLLTLQPEMPNTQAQPADKHTIVAWQAKLLIELSAELLSSLTHLAATTHYRQLVGTPVSDPFDNKRAWGLLPYPGKHAPPLMMLVDYPTEQPALQANLRQQRLIYALAAFVLALLLAIMLRGPIRRLQQQTHLMPLLGQKQFQKIREDIFENQRAWPDELDLLDQAMCTLTYQLESLEQAVDVRTQEMERLSLFDTLTGLANRHLFQYELQSELKKYKQQKHDKLTAILLLDLDKFKRINDSLGHQQGDLLLERLGQRLKHSIRSMGMVARLGGDEFALLIRHIKHPQQLDIICEKILELVSKPFELKDSKVVVQCSIGVSLANMNDSATDLIKHAEIAMYKAKGVGGNSFQRFNTDMATEAKDSLSLESDIRRGFEQKEFTLFLQPKVSMAGQIKSFEALVRWDHEERGLLPPGEFIPAMEHMGFISELDNWMLEITCRQLKVLEDMYPQLSISVNISSTHFTDHAFLAFLQSCLKKYPIDPSRLELEITETLLMENMSAGLVVINKIKQLGVRIALDDFGTGYSSLSYLKTLPIDTVKIDREFIKDIPDSECDMQISSVIIFLAKQLHFEVVAEGVETTEQLAFLKENHCDLAQGFYFSKPIAAHKALLMLESERLNQAAG